MSQRQEQWHRVTAVKADQSPDGSGGVSNTIIIQVEDGRLLHIVSESHVTIGVAIASDDLSLDYQSTFDLFAELLTLSKGSLRVKVFALYDIGRDDSFRARLVVQSPDNELKLIECRPGDGINIALRFGARMAVAERVFERLEEVKRKTASKQLHGLSDDQLTEQ